MGQREGRLGQKAFQPHPPGAVGGDLGGGPVPFSGGGHGVSLHQGTERVKQDGSVTARHTRRLYEEAVMVRITPV